MATASFELPRARLRTISETRLSWIGRFAFVSEPELVFETEGFTFAEEARPEA